MEVELVTSYWGILITIPVWQPSLFSMPKSGSACEKNPFPEPTRRRLAAGGGRGPRTDIVSKFSRAFVCFIFFFCNFLICLQLAGGMFVFDTLAQANTLAHANTPVQILLVVEAVYSVSLGIRSYLHSSSGKHFHCSIPRFIKYPLCECKCVCEREKGRGGKARWWT